MAATEANRTSNSTNEESMNQSSRMASAMSSKPKTIKIPGPDHPIAIERNPNRVVVKVADRVVADTRDALTLQEAGYAPVFYIPRKDVDMALLQRTEHSTYCP
jgi:uncharacterized protein (DUF427 family)